MCMKNVLFMVLVYIIIIVHPGETVADEIIVSQEFEQIFTDFILQNYYHKSNASDVCETPAEKYINADFKKSKLYEQFELEKYLADDSKCENLCLKVNYEIEENDVNSNNISIVTIVPVLPVIRVPTETANVTSTPVPLIPVIPNTNNTSTVPILLGTDDNNTATSTEKNDHEETTTEGNSKNLTDSETGEQIGENFSGGKRTAVIVAATALAVGGAAVASFFIVNGVKAILQSGTYVFPESANA